MIHRTLGRAELSVSPLCFGGNVLGWTTDEKRSFEVLDAYVDGGGNFIDTADTYSTWVPGHVGGESEIILGNWMSARKNRSRVIIATKLGSRMGTAPNAQGLSRRYIMEEVEASLKRLQTDYIDLYQAHRDDPNTPLEETMAAFDDLVRQGKVRAIGASNYSAARLADAQRVSDQHGYARYECLQPPYSLVNRAEYERDLEALCLEQGIAVITYSSLASGFLSGKYRQGQALPSSPRAKGIAERYMNEKGFRILEQLDRVVAAHHATVGQIALAWIIARPGITAAIASGTSVEQVRELLGAAEITLSADEMQTLDGVSAWKKD
ncbi:MAG TPA: aldo/keto reductase [Ktedonobacteraceae bacterium]|nr:aldo/keto reductase [Ktedonobacteraceae bacterium]